MAIEFSHATIDHENAEHDRLVAASLRRNPRVLRLARQQLKRWSKKDGKNLRPAFAEWKRILEYLSRREIADFLVSDTPLCRRLRQSSPFAGLARSKTSGVK